MRPARAREWLMAACILLAWPARGLSCGSGSYLIQWPAVNPVWQMCATSPAYSSGISGSGLELTNVTYNGHTVFFQAHAPIMNVIYDPGAACNCFRDWLWQEVTLSTDNVLTVPASLCPHGLSSCAGYAEPTSPPQTVCDVGPGGGDVGTFTGIAAEKLADRLILTSHMRAGWYRYTQKWTFFADGRIQPQMFFAEIVFTSCTTFVHRHHNYWRFDFDIDGAANDVVDVPWNGGAAWPWNQPKPLSTERAFRKDKTPYWIVKDAVTGRGYKITPGPTDLAADSFSKADFLALRYNAGEIDDGAPGCEINYLPFVNGEAINRQDIVVWYRGGALDLSTASDDCENAGPMLEPVGDWSP